MNRQELNDWKPKEGVRKIYPLGSCMTCRKFVSWVLVNKSGCFKQNEFRQCSNWEQSEDSKTSNDFYRRQEMKVIR